MVLINLSQPAWADDAPLTDDERRTLERYEAQEQAYQKVAMKQLKSQINSLERVIRDIRRDKTKSEPARDASITTIETRIEHLQGMLDQLREGTLVLAPQLECERLRTGHFGTLTTADQQFTGYGYTTVYDAISRYRYAYDPARQDKGHLVYMQTVNANGQTVQLPYGTIFEVVERLDAFRDKPAYKLREIDINALRAKRDKEQAKAPAE